MDSLAAAPGTGPNTGPMMRLRAPQTPKKLNELPRRTLVMGILNVTEDSFSDGGRHADADAAVRHGLAMHYGGADIVDVGGESTRPDAEPVDPETEAERILPVIRALAKAGASVTVDTKNASTARAALEAGAVAVNDVSGNLLTDEMAALIAETGAGYILMHSRGPVKSQDPSAQYGSAPAEVAAELAECVRRLEAAGVAREQIVLDPGLGFNKEAEDNWDILRGLGELEAIGLPLLIGASRKRFLGRLLASGGKDRPVGERDAATLALTALLAQRGVWGVRVHDVEGSADAVAVAEALSGRDRDGRGRDGQRP
ncbi:dihydropteroate synthase [Arthrobacter sp. UM1]|uniref:dihydropteroate synthase n=1 Tax=Arthrobacter sp. UM1 TaxID=2766776 RepID=UPI001CF6BF2C|nr:dihydropteroate synthase [Arthrobacter sp. UM1]MCB4208900.1 dihydropteroate synthase [Arthrobacter sp. UM1]